MTPAPTAARKSACSSCSLRALCLPAGCSKADLAVLEGLQVQRSKVPVGRTLFHPGDPCDAIFAIRRGAFKTRIPWSQGRHQITGFPMRGDLIGLDGIGSGAYACDAIALEDCEVCIIPCSTLEQLCRQVPVLRRNFNQLLGAEITREARVMEILRTLNARQRLAAFLLDLIHRQAHSGPVPSEIVLKMHRQEIGAYLGLALETVSRCLSQLQRDGILTVERRRIRVRDRAALVTEGRTAAAAGTAAAAA